MALPVQSKTKRSLALLFTVPLAFSLMFFIANTNAENTDIEILTVQNLRSTLHTMFALAQDAETSERGFLLTGDERYLLPYEQAQSQIKTQIELCRVLFKDRPEMKHDVDLFTNLVQNKFEQVQKTLQAQQKGGFSAALEYVKSGAGQDTMDEIRRINDGLQLRLSDELTAAHDHQRSLNRRVFLFFLVGTAITIIVLIALYNMLIDYIHGQDTARTELASLNMELEHRIEERTRELQQMNEELQQFAYVASHDLQEPLRTITSFTQLLATRYSGKLDEDADEFITYIVTSSRRMTDLISGLLALVRLRKTGQPTGAVSFEKLLTDAETSLQASIRESEARIEHTPLPSLAVDTVQITQLFQNLISNAIKYRRSESPVVKVSAKRTASEWVISVADNGQGFEQQYAERIFGLFQRLHSREVEGTGMGLSISRKIVERHGGRIWAESEVGRGSTFHFSLPISLEVTRSAQTLKPAAAGAR
jgi:signal transduction histidine kinase